MAKKILVVDDSASVRQQLRLALEPVKYEVVEATDGEEALIHLGSGLDISLMICDINMPRLNGIDMLERAKAAGLRPGLPIIMLTTEGQPSLIKRAKEAGARAWIVKPFNATMLVSAVQKLAA